MNWLFHQPTRADKERADVAELQEQSPWLTSFEVRLVSGLRLAIDFTLSIGDDQLGFTLHYPDFFPDIPPSVVPDDPARISGHQWGPGGELCLEYRADNWSPEFTGAMMIASAYRLLSGEVGQDKPPVPSAHNMSVAQEVRASISRFLISGSAKEQLLCLAPENPVDLNLSDHWYAEAWFVQPTGLARDGATYWSETPPFVEELPTRRAGKAMKLSADQRLPQSLNLERLEELLSGGPLEAWVKEHQTSATRFLALIKGKIIRLFAVLSDGSGIKFETIEIPATSKRLPKGHDGKRRPAPTFPQLT